MEYIVKTIDELCVKITDGSHFSPEHEEFGKYPMYSSKDMLYNEFDNSDVKLISEDVYKKLVAQDCRPLKDDILIIKDGNSYLKRIFKAKHDLDAVILSSIAILRPNSKEINPDFFVYLLRSTSIRNAMANYVSGAAIPRIVLKDFKKMKLKFIKDLETQNGIASILSAYDNLIENNNKRIKILEQMAESLYKEWFVRFRFPGHETTPIKNGIPKGWEVKKIKDCVKRLPFNQTYKANELEPEGKVIVVDQSADAYIGFHNNEPSHKANVESPILLFGDHSCKFVLMIKDFSLGENIVPFTSINADWLNSYYLFYATHKIIETTEYKRHWGQFVSMRILVPSSTLQQKFSDFMKSIHKELDELFIANMNLIKQRDLLLPRLMSGKLAV